MVELEKKAQRTTDAIKEKESEIAAAIAADELLTEVRNRDIAAAHVAGRISLFLESCPQGDELPKLENQAHHLQARVDELEHRLDKNNSNERLSAIMDIISAQMTKYIQQFEAELQEYPARFDLTQITIKFSRPERKVPLNRTGGGAN